MWRAHWVIRVLYMLAYSGMGSSAGWSLGLPTSLLSRLVCLHIIRIDLTTHSQPILHFYSNQYHSKQRHSKFSNNHCHQQSNHLFRLFCDVILFAWVVI